MACGVGLGIFAVAPALVVRTLAGGAYLAAAPNLLEYGVAMTFLAATNVVISYKIAAHRFAFVAPLGGRRSARSRRGVALAPRHSTDPHDPHHLERRRAGRISLEPVSARRRLFSRKPRHDRAVGEVWRFEGFPENARIFRTVHGVLKRRMILVAGSVLLPIAATGATPDEHPTVTTFSGTGALGSRDGRDPTYTLPVGVAFDSAGRLYVADAAAQRIRVVERDGTTRTFAGPDGPVNTLVTTGGYVDGPARTARFNWPLGLAVGADGAVYVADSNNNCIRRIGQDGIVSTFSGRPGAWGNSDGPAAVATFGLPTGIAANAKDLYVADRYGIRKVAADGSVTTLRNLGQAPWAVAVRQRPAGPVVIAADRNGIVARYYVGSDFVDRRFASPQAGVDSTTLSNLGDRVIGNAFGLIALDDYTVAYTDPRTESVRLHRARLRRNEGPGRLGQSGRAADDAAFADGPWDVARFFAPAGIARSDDGRIVVADAGNRRIRLLSTFSRPYDPWKSASDSMYQPNDSDRSTAAYRIAFVGNSQVYSDTGWSDSIENVLQQRLELER